MAPAKVTDAFQATKRGRGVAKGKPKAKSARAAGTYPCVRLVRRRDASKENSHPIPTVTIRCQPRPPADTKPENDTTEEYLNVLKSFDMTSVRPPRDQSPRYSSPLDAPVGRSSRDPRLVTIFGTSALPRRSKLLQTRAFVERRD